MPVARISSSLAKTDLDQLRRQAGRRLVEHQHLRLDDQRAGDRQHLPLAAGQPPGGAVAAAARGRERVACIASIRARRSAFGKHRRGELQVVVDRHRGEDVLGLRHEGEAAGGPARCGRQRVMSAPSSRTRPENFGTSPAIALISVDLPAPFGPRIATISPRATSMLAPRTIGTPGS